VTISFWKGLCSM